MNDDWIRVASGVFQRRYRPLDISIGVIVGRTGLVIVDTRGNPSEAEEILRDVAEDFALPIVAAINTHAHYDHTFGNQVFVAQGIPIFGHHRIPQHFAQHEERRLEKVRKRPESEPDKQWVDVDLTAPTVLVDAPLRIEPGGRVIELLPLAPGHTDTDLAILVPDARVWFLGDVIEQSGPPMYGSGSYPLAWPDALRGLLREIRSDDVIVPGHGSVVDRAFVQAQASQLQAVAEEIRAAHDEGIAPDDVQLGRSLHEYWPESFLRSAVRDAYARLSNE
ncbi:MBL fold metallo-hydrolase [Microbacterium sp. NPDC089698]|uniref:MBL fold metallo-hydrolase n=1 Tax=Microbacterium sp. NPDC089698 TaxID=3364200 RepID=UPI0037F62629